MASLPPDGSGGSSDVEHEITQLNQTLSTLKKQMDSLYTLVEQGVYTPDVFVLRSQALTAKTSSVTQSVSDAEARLSTGRRLEHSRFEIIPRIEHVLAVYPTLTDPREKNNLLKRILIKAVYTKTRGSRWEESDMKLFLFPKLDDTLPIYPLP